MMTETERTNGEKKFAPKKSSLRSFNIQLATHLFLKEGRHMHGGLLSLDRFQIRTTLGDNDLAWRYLVEASARVAGSGLVRRNPIPARDVQEI